ncbi:dienelactone hydrolase family protein [Nocardia sp. NBC_00565]|uniref:dienelactone hydrolase family protein n=1 Tax=Nocardia sp. NBC_00565 TaxID=2975993 RepID=UPI002E80747D|nr:dienelactone hydrolase family protein [Nocardia sp. NBC_00565]WUC05868.1 dienelactone hydrolase family protein [Nocardia sp. NBC_00565]
MTEFRPVAVRHHGADLVGALAVPAGSGPHPAVLVMHTAHGLSEQMRDRAARLAEHGYVALASDMYGGGQFFAEPEQAGEPFSSLMNSPDLMRARTVAWYRTLAALPEVDAARVAAIGFCFGGRCVLELARSGADAKAVVSFHGLLTTSEPAQPGRVRAHVAVYTGAQDPYAPPQHVDAVRQEMRKAGAPCDLTVFSTAGHGFTDPDAGSMGRPGIAYDRVADHVSWSGTLALLDTVLTS